MGEGLVPFWVLRHSFLSLTGCLWLYNIQLKTSRGILFLSPSDAYVRSFLYLLYTLINFVTQKLLAIKPRLWPRIEFFSSGGQEPQHLCMIQQQPFTRRRLECTHGPVSLSLWGSAQVMLQLLYMDTGRHTQIHSQTYSHTDIYTTFNDTDRHTDT